MDSSAAPFLTATIFGAKLRPPALPAGRLPRTNLIAEVDSASPPRLIAVTAPAGYGKSTLAALLLTHLAGRDPGAHSVWLALDEDDDGSVEFLAALLAALAPVVPAAVERAQGLLNQNLSRQVLFQLFAGIEQLASPVFMVLDDFHLIRSPAVHQLLEVMLDRAPESFHLIVLSRRELPIALGRLRLADQIVEINEQRLRLSRDEVRSYVRHVRALHLDEAVVELLAERTEGWIAGLQLLLLSLQRRPADDLSLDALRGDNRLLAEYLTSEVLENQTEEMRAFLLECSILDRLRADLCCAVTGRENASELLLRAADERLFLRRLDSQEQWFDLHHLFRELLARQLQLRYSVRRIAELHLRAAAWYVDLDEVTPALHHYLAAGAPQLAVELVQARARPALIQNYTAELQHWITVLAGVPLDAYPQLLLDLAWLTFFTTDGSLPAALDRVRRCLVDCAVPAYRDELAVLELLVRLNDTDQQGIYRAAEARLAQFHPASHMARGWTYIVLALVGGPLEPEAVLTYTEHAIQEFAALDFAEGEIYALTIRSLIEYYRGESAAAVADYKRAMGILDRQSRPNYANDTSLSLQAGQVFYWRDELAEAVQYFTRALDCARTLNDQFHILAAQIWLQVCRLGQGYAVVVPPEQHQAEVQLLSDPTVAHAVGLKGSFTYFRLLRELAQGTRAEVWRVFEPLGLTLETLPAESPEVVTLATLTAYTVTGRELEALGPVLESFMARSRAAKFRFSELYLQVLTVRQLQQLGRNGRARAVLRRVLHDVEQTGYLRVVMMHPALAPLLRAERSDFAHALAKRMEQSAAPVIWGPLTGQERRIFELLIEGYTIQEIAGEMVLSPATVKWHLGNLYAKLGVKGKRQALAAAAQAGLIKP